MSAIVFLDTETTGLDVGLRFGSEIWEFAAIRREPDGTETEWTTFVDHEDDGATSLPEPFASDYTARYDPLKSLTHEDFRRWSEPLFAGRPHIVGAVPDFDAAGLRQVLAITRTQSPWHYHLIDIGALAIGYLRGKLASDGPTWGYMHASSVADVVHALPWDSNELSRAVGVEPKDFARHTAMGDVLWAKAIYDAVMG